jgi:hypothetical protein
MVTFSGFMNGWDRDPRHDTGCDGLDPEAGRRVRRRDAQATHALDTGTQAVGALGTPVSNFLDHLRERRRSEAPDVAMHFMRRVQFPEQPEKRRALPDHWKGALYPPERFMNAARLRL